jgi:hypothetical protein
MELLLPLVDKLGEGLLSMNPKGEGDCTFTVHRKVDGELLLQFEEAEDEDQELEVVLKTKLELYINGNYKFLFMMAGRSGYCGDYCLYCRLLDLSPLIRLIGFYHEGCLLTCKSTNSKYPYFICNTCRLFRGSFVSSDYSSEHSSNKFYFDVARSTTDHGRDCLGGTVVILTGYADILPHSRDLVSHINASFYRSDKHALITHRNIKQLMLPRYNLSQLSQSAFSWILIQMRSIFLKQNANDYCHLPFFLWRFHSLNPQATVALQVDDHDSFYRMFVAIPRAAEVFRAMMWHL